MIDTHKLRKRDLYLNKIIAFQGTEPVKVITGIRRCGKSSLQKLQEAIDYIDWKQGFYDDVLAGKTAYYSNLIDCD